MPREDKGCFNCNHQDKDNSEFPCSECHTYLYDKWEPIKQDGGVDLWED